MRQGLAAGMVGLWLCGFVIAAPRNATIVALWPTDDGQSDVEEALMRLAVAHVNSDPVLCAKVWLSLDVKTYTGGESDAVLQAEGAMNSTSYVNAFVGLGIASSMNMLLGTTSAHGRPMVVTQATVLVAGMACLLVMVATVQLHMCIRWVRASASKIA